MPRGQSGQQLGGWSRIGFRWCRINSRKSWRNQRFDRRSCTWSAQQVKREKKSGQLSRLFGEKGEETGMDAQSRWRITQIHQRVQNQMRIQRGRLRSWSVRHVHWSSLVLGSRFSTQFWAWILPWSWERTQRYGQRRVRVLPEDYMSSEESDVEGKFLVKELAWESGKVEKRKQQLDKFYNEQHCKPTRERLVKRVRGEVLSAQQKPVDCPDWACINTNNSSSISTQGWALAELSDPWMPTFALGDLENLKSHEFSHWEHWAPLNFPSSSALSILRSHSDPP